MNNIITFDETDWYLEIGERIKTARKDLNLTQSDLAEKAGLKRASITHIENGNQKTSVYTLYKISKVLNRPLISLLPEDVREEDQVVIGGKAETVTPKAKNILEELLAQ